MDGEFTESHETDIDCGGQYCLPCSLGMVSETHTPIHTHTHSHTLTQGCMIDTDCAGETVCLYGHRLPSQLLYISAEDREAYTCGNTLYHTNYGLCISVSCACFKCAANSTVPQVRLEALLSTISSELPFTVAGNSSIQEIEQSFHSYITEVEQYVECAELNS